MTKTKYKLVKKAYSVGSKWDVKNIGHPECGAETVIIDKGEKKSKAIAAAQYVKYNDDIESYIDICAIRDKSYDLYEYKGELRTLHDIWTDELTEKYRADLKQLLIDNPNTKCYIYSSQWNQYWCANSAGYTNDVRRVGVYTIDEAVSIALGVGIEKRLEIQIIK